MSKMIIIIKVGTNVLTNGKQDLDKLAIKNLVVQISKLVKENYQVVLVSSGAVGAGKVLCPQLEINKNKNISKRTLAAVGQIKLLELYREYFAKNKIINAQILVERRNMADRKNYLQFRDTLLTLLEQNIVPIINENDVTTPQEWQFGENDQLAVLVAIALNASKVILCTDVNGLYTDDPRINKQATQVSNVANITLDLQKFAKKSSSGVGFGGMMSKIQAVKIAMQAGIEAYILNGKEDNVILDVCKNKKTLGTRFVSKQVDLKNFQRWLAAGAHTYGKIYIDEGAEKALRKRNSLLIVGITYSKGDFVKGDIVDIYNHEKKHIAVGMVNYTSQEVKNGLAIANKKNLKEVIHCDNLVLV